MSSTSKQQAEEFLRICHQFRLGDLVTESSHPATANLSETARESIPAALDELFEADTDVVCSYRALVESGRFETIAATLRDALRAGGKVVFTGCGSTGRLSILLASIWRDFWKQQRKRGAVTTPSTEEWENRAFAVMAGGDFALIKSVEGFEDFTQFGRKQIDDLGVGEGDVVFAITEGGETSFVIGTAWEGLERGAKVYFVYNNPDAILCEHVKRSREVIEEPRIEKINLTTGPMAITGSTRMQATTIQLCVLVTVLEMVVRDLMSQLEPGGPAALPSSRVPEEFEARLEQMHAHLRSEPVRESMARLVAMEEDVYRSGHKTNYYADRFAIDILTDTTERSPTFCTPPFRRFDDTTATESWAFLFLPHETTEQAWEHILMREPTCVEWTDDEVRGLVPDERAERTIDIVRRIGRADLMKFRIGMDGLAYRNPGRADAAVAIAAPCEPCLLREPTGFFRARLENARAAGARIGAVVTGPAGGVNETADSMAAWAPEAVVVALPVPQTDFLLDGVTRAGLKMMLNAMSTCTMVRLGRVMGNTMVWVVPSNLKLIDRSTRYIQRLTGLEYTPACYLLHEVMEYVAPRMLADQAYPPVVGVSVLRARHGLSNEEAEERLTRQG